MVHVALPCSIIGPEVVVDVALGLKATTEDVDGIHVPVILRHLKQGGRDQKNGDRI